MALCSTSRCSCPTLSTFVTSTFCSVLADCSAAYGGPVLDGIVFYQPLEVTDSFKAATERYMQHRFEPKLKVGVKFFHRLAHAES